MPQNFKSKSKGLTIPERKNLYKKEILDYLYRRRSPVTLRKIADSLGISRICLHSTRSIGRNALDELVNESCVVNNAPSQGYSITEEGRRFYEMKYLNITNPDNILDGLRGPFREVFPEVLRSIKMAYPDFANLIERYSFVEKTHGNCVHLCFMESIKINLYEGAGAEILKSSLERYFRIRDIIVSKELVEESEPIAIPQEIPEEIEESKSNPSTPGIVDKIISLVDQEFSGNLAQTHAIALSSPAWRVTIEKV